MKIKDIIKHLKPALENDEFEKIDSILEEVYSTEINLEALEKIDDILQEATLYSELKDDEYKQEALRLIGKYR